MKKGALQKNKGVWVCLVGILVNLLLSAGKIALGVLTGLVSVTADGFNNLSDCGSGVVALVSLAIAEKPADKRHPYGHRRAEYVAAMITGFFILLLFAELFRESIGGILRPDGSAGSLAVYLVLGISIAVKAGMFLFYRVFSKRLGSDALNAAARDSLCDSLSTAAVIVGALLCAPLPAADGWVGLLVSLFIAYQGVAILIEASSKLLGQAPDEALAARIRGLILADERALGVHDLRIYTYGRGAAFATIHVEMDAAMPMLAAHTVIDGLEQQVARETGVSLTIHIDPVDLTNREESSLKIKVWEAARGLADGLEMHDFRLIPGTDRVEFDVGVPYACKLADDALSRALTDIVRSLGPYEPIIRIERE